MLCVQNIFASRFEMTYTFDFDVYSIMFYCKLTWQMNLPFEMKRPFTTRFWRSSEKPESIKVFLYARNDIFLPSD